MSKRSSPYLAFTLDTPHDVARTKFKEKIGVFPDEVFTSKGLVLAGPLKENECSTLDKK